jgi:hypothetical protein
LVEELGSAHVRIHILMERILTKCSVETGPSAMIYVPDLIKTGSGIQKLIGWLHRQRGAHINLLIFFKLRKGGL